MIHYFHLLFSEQILSRRSHEYKYLLLLVTEEDDNIIHKSKQYIKKKRLQLEIESEISVGLGLVGPYLNSSVAVLSP